MHLVEIISDNGCNTIYPLQGIITFSSAAKQTNVNIFLVNQGIFCYLNTTKQKYFHRKKIICLKKNLNKQINIEQAIQTFLVWRCHMFMSNLRLLTKSCFLLDKFNLWIQRLFIRSSVYFSIKSPTVDLFKILTRLWLWCLHVMHTDYIIPILIYTLHSTAWTITFILKFQTTSIFAAV